MIDSARARTVGSSSTTRAVVGLARFGFIRPTPLAFENGNHGAKAKFRLSQLFYNFDFNCCTYAAETQIPEAATDYKLWPFPPIRGVFRRITAPHYRDQADRACRLSSDADAARNQ